MSNGAPATRVVAGLSGMYEKMAASLPSTVHCTACGAQEDVSPAYCLAHGWPKCCGLTMRLGPLPED